MSLHTHNGTPRNSHPGARFVASLLIVLLALGTLTALPAGAARQAQATAAPTTAAPTAAAPTSAPTSAATAAATAPAGTPDANRPSAEAGAPIYAQHCAACHGAGGKGDGPQAGQIITQTGKPLPDFTSVAYARAAKPSDWLAVTRDGRMDKFMPPWKQTLSEKQIRDVTYFLLTLSTTPENVHGGQQSYAADCAGCHGQTGKGDGANAKAGMPDLSQAATLEGMSGQDIFTAISDKHKDVTGFPASIPDDQKWALVDAVRTLGYDYAAPAGAPLSPTVKLDVTGVISNGTAGGDVTKPLTVTLDVFDRSVMENPNAAPVAVGTYTETARSGAFAFKQVGVPQGGVLLGTVHYDGIAYRSFTLLQTDAISATLPPIVIYESTKDETGLRIAQMHVLFEAQGAAMNVTEVFQVTTGGDRAFNGDVNFTLPAGASSVQFPNSAPEQFAVQGAAFKGNMSVPPGAQGGDQLVVTFQLPFQNPTHVEQSVPYPVDTLAIFSTDTMSVSGAGVQPMADANLPQGFLGFQGSPLEKGAAMALDVSANAGAASNTGGTGTGGTAVGGLPSWALPALGGLALVLVLGGLGGWYWQRTRSREDEDLDEDEFEDEDEDEESGDEAGSEDEEEALSREELLQAIADLDDEYEGGTIDPKRYRRDRAVLKAQLAAYRDDRNA